MMDTKQQFVANAVFIPDHTGSIDPDDCVKLMVVGDNNSAEVYTEDAWLNDGKPFCNRENGEFSNENVQLIPELWIVKIDEREHWSDDVLKHTKRLYGMYVFDRNRHVHICSVTPSYELHWIGSDIEFTESVYEDEDLRERVHDAIDKGDSHCELVSYFNVCDIDRMLKNEIQEGFMPPENECGGYRIDGFENVTYDEMINEAMEYSSTTSL